MNENDIKTYFNDFIKQYIPYKESKSFIKLVDFISDKYLSDLYNKNPLELKQLFENNSIPIEVYNNLLYSIGVSKNIIDSLSLNDKILFFSALSDFQRYKGTVKFFKKVAETFNDKFNIYELYVGEDQFGNIVFKPQLIYNHSEDNNTSIKNINYSDVYNNIPNFLISIDNIVNLKINNNIILPVKTNLILLEYDFTSNADMIIGIITSSVLKEYGHIIIDLYIDDQIYQIKLLDIYFLWYYIISKTYNISWFNQNQINIPNFSIHNAYRISDLDKIIFDYKRIKNNNDTYIFYKKYIQSKIGFIHSRIENVSSMDNTISGISKSLYTYLNDYIFSEIDKDSLIIKCNKVLNEIYSSLLLIQENNNDELFTKYFSKFITFLPGLTYYPEYTTSFIILSNYKPFHVNFIVESNSKVKPVEIATPGFENSFKIEMSRNDYVNELNEVAGIVVDMFKLENVHIEENYEIMIEWRL